MGVILFLRSSAAILTVLAAGATPALAQDSKALTSLSSKVAELDVQAQALKRELEFTQYKRASTEAKLHQTQLDLKEKEATLEQLQTSLPEQPSARDSERLGNEQQRVALAELNIKSIMAAVVRLERKEVDLRNELDALTTERTNTAERIANIEARSRAEADARARAAEAELAALKRENEQLKLAMEEEARRAREAADAAGEAQRAAELAALQEHQELQEQMRTENEAQQLEEQARQLQAAASSSPAEVAEEEPPVYIGDDGEQVVVRSRSIESPVVMQPVAPGVYRAEVAIEPGRAYFDVRNRRFRGHFPDAEDPQTYVVEYDTSGEGASFSVRTKGEDAADTQMYSDSTTAF